MYELHWNDYIVKNPTGLRIDTSDKKPPSPTFCNHIWTHLYKHTDDKVKLCCIDKGMPIGDLRSSNLNEIRNSKLVRQIRRDVLDGKRLKRCSVCWDNEDNNQTSYRISEPTHDYYDETAKPITFLDYRADNICNLACKICGSDYSTKLIDVELSLGEINQQTAAKLRRLSKTNIKISELEPYLRELNKIYFAGGEPLISQQHWDILDTLINKNISKNIKISYSTNLSTLDFKNYSVENYWPKFKSCDIMASIDGMDGMFEYFRTGAKWDTTLNNIKRINKINKQYLTINATVGWVNLNSIIDLFIFLIKNKLLDDPNKFGFNPLYGNFGGRVEETPDIARDELLSKIDYCISYMRDKFGKRFNITEVYSQLKLIETKIINSNSTYKFDSWIRQLKHNDKRYGTRINSILTFKNDKINELISDTYNSITT